MDNELHILLNKRFNLLLNSYKTLKIILIPNLPNDKNSFMKILFDIILSQINLFIRLSTLKNQKKIFDLINNNTQVLSNSVLSFYNLFSYSNSTSTEENSKAKYLEFNYTNNNKEIFSKNPVNLRFSNEPNIKSEKKEKNTSFEPLKISFTETNKFNLFNSSQNENDNNKISFTSRNIKKANYVSIHKDLKIKNIQLNKIENPQVLYKESNILQADKDTKIFNNSSLQKDEVYVSVCSTNRSMDKLNKNKSTPKITQSYNNIKNITKIRKKKTPLHIKENITDNKNNNILNFNNNFSEKFSLDNYLIPCKSKKPNDSEKIYLTKDGSIIISENQKNMLEKYINECANERMTINQIIPKNKTRMRNTISHLKKNTNKKIFLNDNPVSNEINNENIQKLLNNLPDSFQKIIEDFIRKKRTIYFNKDIASACHITIDSNTEIDDKDKNKNNSKNKTRYKSNNDKLLIIQTEPEPTLRRMKSKKNFNTEPNLTVNNTNIDNQ